MDPKVLFGVGLSLLSFFARSRFPSIPHWLSEGGIVSGVVAIALAGFPSVAPANALILAAIVGAAYSGARRAFQRAPVPVEDTRYQDLAEFTERAALIQKRYLGTHDGSEIMEAQTKWAAEVCAYLRDHVGKGQANRFEFADASRHSGPVGYDLLGQGQYALIIARRQALHDIMAAL